MKLVIEYSFRCLGGGPQKGVSLVKLNLSPEIILYTLCTYVYPIWGVDDLTRRAGGVIDYSVLVGVNFPWSLPFIYF